MSNNILNTSNSNTHQHLQHLLHSSNSSGSSSSGSNSNSNNTRFTTNNQQQQQLLFEQIQQQSKMIPNSSSSSTLSKKSSLSHMTNIDDAASAFAVHSGGSGGGGGGSSGGIGSPSSILKIHSNSNNNNSNNNNVSLPSLSDINWNNNSNSNPNINNSSANNNHHHHNHNHHHNHSHTHHSQSSQNSNNINNSSGGVSPLTNSHQSDYSSNSNSSSSSSNNKLGNIMDVPSSPEFSHLHQQQQQQQHHRSTTLSSSSSSSSMVVDSANVRLQQYEASIESLINQVQSAHDREQKQRSYTKSIEEGYANLESENLKLKKELFEMNKKLNEILQMKFSPQPTISAPTSSSSSNLPITSKFTSSLAVSGSLPPPPSHADKKKLELQQKKKPRGGNGAIEGDEELVAEALGSFVELTSTSSSRKPMLKRSNSEDSFRHNPNQGMSMMSPHAMIMASRGGDPTSSSMDWAMGNSSDLDDLKFKKRRSDQFMNSPPTEQPPAGTKTKKPPQFNPSSPPNLQRHHSFSINSPVKLESSLHSSGGIMELSSSPSSSSNQLTSSGGILKKPKKQNNNNNNNNIQTTTTTSTSTPQQQSHFPSQMQNIGQLPEMETDVDSTDEFDFKGSTGMPRSGDGDSPDSNENSRNSSSPIEAPMSDANLFKSIANDTPHEALLNEIHHLHQLQRESLEKMHLTQKQFLTTDGANNHDDIYAALQTEQKKLAGQIESELQTLNQMYSQTILEPNQLCKLDILLQDLSIQYKQLQLYQNELNYGPGGPELPVALVITKQPFPMVISKFKQLQEDHLTVQLLVGSNVDIISYSPIRAELIFHSKALTKGSATLIGGIGSVNSGTGGSGGNSALKKHIEKDTQSIDPVKGNAKFPIKFLTGTRKGCVKLHFVLQIKTTDGHLNVSTLSHTESTIPPFRRELKNTVLEPYYSKRQNSQNFLGSGYDPLT
ncbi:signal transducer and activator of transcription family protein [Heterostelium album PN500]|uniref:Signal transducer and activator of transcription family protein n=1 Tax=Heterostelium pallidum (strain ATCC 26659 / Pp 5 / PN500) TaxID=670386 RepID=D3BS24_HETP5|nr:signal transducer and activator of transcription family protein [Heterostelium album PN500]EFA75761.1 signal transducer and activator of transcription family protein [Heterostelium album PN500]|eukprot:XP_020427895.1 signal transducer and activator of transcription family protein [Heterostelium album PN500]